MTTNTPIPLSVRQARMDVAEQELLDASGRWLDHRAMGTLPNPHDDQLDAAMADYKRAARRLRDSRRRMDDQSG